MEDYDQPDGKPTCNLNYFTGMVIHHFTPNIYIRNEAMQEYLQTSFLDDKWSYREEEIETLMVFKWVVYLTRNRWLKSRSHTGEYMAYFNFIMLLASAIRIDVFKIGIPSVYRLKEDGWGLSSAYTSRNDAWDKQKRTLILHLLSGMVNSIRIDGGQGARWYRCRHLDLFWR